MKRSGNFVMLESQILHGVSELHTIIYDKPRLSGFLSLHRVGIQADPDCPGHFLCC